MISLRDVMPEDKDMIRNWRNLPEVRQYMYTDHIISPEEHGRWFQGIFGDPKRRFWIVQSDDKPVGLVSLHDIDEHNKRCYGAIYIAKPGERAKGAGTFASHSVMRYAFDELSLNKLCCETLAFNDRVIEMYKSLGLVQEGLYRRHVRKGDQFVDVVALAILREEWEVQKPEIEARLRTKGLIP